MPKKQQDLFDTQPAPWELDEQSDQLIARVAFAEAPFGPYDYLVPDQLRDALAVGCRVRVPLGKRQRLTHGYCCELIAPGLLIFDATWLMSCCGVKLQTRA